VFKVSGSILYWAWTAHVVAPYLALGTRLGRVTLDSIHDFLDSRIPIRPMYM
jgi:hypothetical protein